MYILLKFWNYYSYFLGSCLIYELNLLIIDHPEMFRILIKKYYKDGTPLKSTKALMKILLRHQIIFFLKCSINSIEFLIVKSVLCYLLSIFYSCLLHEVNTVFFVCIKCYCDIRIVSLLQFMFLGMPTPVINNCNGKYMYM